jgi:dihydrofolate reductase
MSSRFTLHVVMAINSEFYYAKNGWMPWPNIPSDMKRFKNLTQGRVVVMGRKTYEQLPANVIARLPVAVVVSRSGSIKNVPDNVLIVDEVETIRDRVDEFFGKEPTDGIPEYMFIGGGELLASVTQYVHNWTITLVQYTIGSKENAHKLSEETLLGIGFPVRSMPHFVSGMRFHHHVGNRVDPMQTVMITPEYVRILHATEISPAAVGIWQTLSFIMTIIICFAMGMHNTAVAAAIIWALWLNFLLENAVQSHLEYVEREMCVNRLR